MQLYTIETGFFKLDGGAMFGVVPKLLWQKLIPPDENNLITMAMRCLLIETGNRLVLVDTGIGNKQDAKFFGHYHLHGEASMDRSLRAHGFQKEDITDVFLTHLHFDHCGGAIRREGDQLVPAFGNAVYWCNQSHWEWATKPNEREKASFLPENILPLQESGRLKMIAEPVQPGETTVFTDEIEIRFVNGHTASMMLPQIQYHGKTIVYMADLIPTAAHLPIPHVMAYDMFPLTTLQEKKSFLLEAIGRDYILYFEHDPKAECCTLQQTEKGIRQKELLRLADL